MSTENKTPEASELPPVQQPELIPEPGPPGLEKNGYRQARTDIESKDDVSLVENFIGSIYGEAKRIDSTNIGDSKFTQGLKFNAQQEIVNLRRSVGGQHQQQPQQQLQSPQNVSQNVPPSLPPVSLPPVPMSPQQQLTQAPQPTGDSLILKHEIDQLKEQVKDIKKLYDEFFKLKQVKGHWTVIVDSKGTKTTSIAKTWNVINKQLKNKSKQIIIKYIEDE